MPAIGTVNLAPNGRPPPGPAPRVSAPHDPPQMHTPAPRAAPLPIPPAIYKPAPAPHDPPQIHTSAPKALPLPPAIHALSPKAEVQQNKSETAALQHMALQQAAQSITAAKSHIFTMQVKAQEKAALTAARLAQAAQAKQAGGGGLGLAAISGFHGGNAADAITKEIGKIGGNLGSDIINLPGGLIQGATQLGGAAIDDLTHGRFGNTNLNQSLGMNSPSHLETAVSAAAHADPVFNLVTGHPGNALKLAEAHPLNAIMDATGIGGVLGRAAGAVARTGAVGDAARTFASTARASKVIAPGFPGTDLVQHFSPNLFKSAAQHFADAHPNQVNALRAHSPLAITDHLGMTGDKAALRQQTALITGPARTATFRDVTNTVKDIRNSVPHRDIGVGRLKIARRLKDEANVSQYTTAFGMGTKEQLAAKLEQLKNARAGAEGPLSKTNADLLNEHIKNLEAAVAKPNLDTGAIRTDAAAYRARQTGIEQQQADLGMHTPGEMQAALEKQYALERISGSDFLNKPVTTPEAILARRRAGGAVREAQSNLDAITAAAKDMAGAHKGASRALASATKRLPVHFVNDNLATKLMDERSAVATSASATKETAAEHIAAAKDGLTAAKQDYALTKVNVPKLHGLVVEDPSVMPFTSGFHVGRSLRNMTSEEVQAHMAQDPVASSYVNMTNPERTGALSFRKPDEGVGAGSSSKIYTGAAARKGDWAPGRVAMNRSQLDAVRKIGAVRMQHTWLDRVSMKDEHGGTQYFDSLSVDRAKAAYESAHPGHEVVPWEDSRGGPDAKVLVPKAASDEMSSQINLENPKGIGGDIGRLSMKANRAFRNTVLPLSKNLPIMHTVENTTRGILAGATPMSNRLAHNVLNEMTPEEAAHLQSLVAPGGHAGSVANLDQEDLGHLDPRHHTLPVKALLAVPHYWNNMAHTIIGVQRWTEKEAQLAAFGVHARQQLQEMGVSWAEANTTMSKYAHQLAEGYKDPALAEDAAKFVHRTMGQYGNFTARQRWMFSRVAPFLPWYKNATQLIFQVLPKDHPLTTTLTTDLAHANQAQWNQTHSGIPADMRSYAKLGPGHYLDIGRLLPIGIEHNLLAEAAPLVLPQYQGAAAALLGKGHDAFWGDFKGPNTPYGQAANLSALDQVLQAGDQLGGSFLGPASALTRAVFEHGSSAYNTSLPLFGDVQLKPGSNHGPGGWLGGLDRVFNPGYGVYYGVPTNIGGGGTAGTSSGPIVSGGSGGPIVSGGGGPIVSGAGAIVSGGAGAIVSGGGGAGVYSSGGG